MKVLSNMTQHPPTVQNIKILYQCKPNNEIHYYSFELPLCYFPTWVLTVIFQPAIVYMAYLKSSNYLIFTYDIFHSSEKKAYNFILEKVLSYMNKTGHFTITILVSWVKDIICIGKNVFDLLKQNSNPCNYPVMNSYKCNLRWFFFLVHFKCLMQQFLKRGYWVYLDVRHNFSDNVF